MSECIYKFKLGARINASAQVAGEVCSELESRKELTPKNLVDVSRPEDAPLHSAFEWDDSVAAEKYRESQAGYIIRSLEIITQETKEPTPNYVSIRTGVGEKRRYMETRKALLVKDTREVVLGEALRELNSFKRKYEKLSELSDVFAAIDKLNVQN